MQGTVTARSLAEELQKDPEGARILRYFHAKGWGGYLIQIPASPSKNNEQDQQQ